MTPMSILQLLDIFYTRSYGVQQAIDWVGPVKDRSRPNFWVLDPKDPSIEFAQLELVPGAKPDQPFLCGLSLELAKPMKMDLAPLEKRYGPPRAMPRLKPHDPVPMQFAVRGDYEGTLILGVLQGEGTRRWVASVLFRRYPPA